jgi:uncharacterized membrane protein
MMPLHPSIVHFPPVLLVAAAILYGMGITLRKPTMEIVGFGFHVAGLIFCIVAIFTGDYEAERIAMNPVIREGIHRHENLVMMATYGFGMMGIWAFLRQKSNILWEKFVFVLVFSSLVVLLFVGAHLGGKMVYHHGAGIAPLQEQIRQSAPAEEPVSNDDL